VNYLAHFYLADTSSASLAGSLMGDFAKGCIEGRFAYDIERAIRIHRAIDSFTDNHAIVRSSRQRIDPSYRLLRGILIDVFYDHFLARNWDRFSSEPLESFTSRVYASLDEHRHHFSEPLSWIAPLMASEDWLGSYHELDGIAAILRRMSRRLRRPNRLGDGVTELQRHYAILEQDFFDFLPCLERYTHQLNEALKEHSE